MLDGIEIVSPVLQEDWQGKVSKLFAVMDRSFTLVSHESAGTHVHVAPLGRSWTLAEIRQISKGIVAWREPLSVLMERQRDRYATWNTWSYLSSVSNDVDALSMNDLVQKISPTRYHAWNLRPLEDVRGTIEFRRPYQTLSLEGAQHWVATTLGLFAAFIRNGELDIPATDAETRKRIRKEVHKLDLGKLLQPRCFD